MARSNTVRQWGFLNETLQVVVVGNPTLDAAVASVISDPTGNVFGGAEFLLNRFMGAVLLTAAPAGANPSFGVRGFVCLGLLRVPAILANDGLELASGVAGDRADQSWLWREYRAISVDGGAGAPPAGVDLDVPVCGYYQVLEEFPSGGTVGGRSNGMEWNLDWPLRGGAGTNVQKDVRLVFTLSYIAFESGTAAYAGVGWRLRASVAGVALGTAG